LKGFIKIFDSERPAFPDYSGKQEFITAANIIENPRVHLLFPDIANKSILSLWGKAEVLPMTPHPLSRIQNDPYAGQPDNLFLIHVKAWDLKVMPQLPQSYSQDEVDQKIEDLQRKILKLEQKLEEARNTSS